jgi:hypothetical protein
VLFILIALKFNGSLYILNNTTLLIMSCKCFLPYYGLASYSLHSVFYGAELFTFREV